LKKITKFAKTTILKLHKFTYLFFCFFSVLSATAQHSSVLDVQLKTENAELIIEQELTFVNTSEVSIKKIVLNDWNNAFSSKKSALAKRFSDEFLRSFYYASEKELGKTTIFKITDLNNSSLKHKRIENQIDLIEIELQNLLEPNQKITIKINYSVKLPHQKFTHYGFYPDGKIEIRDWILFPAMFQNDDFLRYSNENLNDVPNAITDFTINFRTDKSSEVSSNLQTEKITENQFVLTGKKSNYVYLSIEPQRTFKTFKNEIIEVETNLFDKNIDEITTQRTIHDIVRFVAQKIGESEQEKIIVSEIDYKRNPFYGFNQLPSFLRPFPDNFTYELKFLKTYTENYIASNLNIDKRKENWLVSALEMYLIIEYINQYHPDIKMLGTISEIKFLKGFYSTKMNFEDQFYFLYLMMARRNLDQSSGSPKNELIKFNEQIAVKYKSGLELKYLEDFLEQGVLQQSIIDFFALNQTKQTSEDDFKAIIESKTQKNINWYFKQVVHQRSIIDYKISNVSKNKDSVRFTLKNKGTSTVPISVFGIKNDSVLFKNWYENITNDSTFSIKNENYDKLIINYDKKIPEYNMRNNAKSLKGFFSPNKSVKLTIIKDFEDPNSFQLFYPPHLRYNYYDGFAPGFNFSNRSTLKKPFSFDIAPLYSFKQKSIVGSSYIAYENLIREGSLYSVNYAVQTNYYHYAPDATYRRIIPSVLFRIREPNFRDNQKQSVYVRFVDVNREKSNFSTNLKHPKYSVFNLRYTNFKQEVTDYFSFQSDVQVSDLFGKISAEIEFRKLYENNRQLNLRFFAGTFTYRNVSSNFFDFATDRPTDYLFDYNFYGRSEKSGFFSQQYITADGGFKSKLTPYANQWILTTNASFNIWSWIEFYADLGLIKNRKTSVEFLHDNGIRLNLVPDYLEIYFPIYSNLGWEVSQDNYHQHIRFVLTFAPRALLNLVTRKWL